MSGMIRVSKEIVKGLEKKSLYEILCEEEQNNNSLNLSLEERKTILKILKEQNVLEEEDTRIFTIKEITKLYRDFIRLEVPERHMPYMDILKLVRDEIESGYLAWFNFKKGQKNFMVFFYP